MCPIVTNNTNVKNIVSLLPVRIFHDAFQFSLAHTRGSSHGQSRIIRKLYDNATYAAMMSDAYLMWKELEKESGKQLFVWVLFPSLTKV